MATFKDIAALAGVSYGTVSNVFNGNGNVSSDKIKRVHQAAAQLGYIPNQSAKQLRRASSNVLAVIVPNISDKQYADFYTSFRFFAESMGYQTALYLSDNNEHREELLATQIKSTQPAGVAVISALSGGMDPYMQIGFLPNEIVFAEQRPFIDYDYVGFDYRKIGSDLGKKASQYQNVALITESNDCYVTQEIKAGFLREAKTCNVRHYEKYSVSSASLALDILASEYPPEAIFTVILNHAQMLRNVHQNFFEGKAPDFYTLSPLFTIPENSENKYELNYRLLGRTTAQQLIQRLTQSITGPAETILLPAAGLRSWIPAPVPDDGELTMMTLDSPTAAIVKNMARMYTKYTGIPVRVSVFPYDGIHELLTNLDDNTAFDIIRLDATWLSWFAPDIFEPLTNLDDHVSDLQELFLPGLLNRYGGMSQTIYALPETHSSQMLFYRRDLFEDPTIRRLYQEQTRETLRPPQTFAEYNRIAAFFTRKYNPQSPVSYGSTLTLGNTGVAATEFLSRYFALTNHLFDANDRILLSSACGVQALTELVQGSKFSCPNYNAWWRDTARVFAAGDTAMTILYSNYASEMLNRNSMVRNCIGYAMVPGSNPMYGGGSIGVCKYSKKKALAYHFIRWLCSETVSTAMSKLGSVSPCRDTYDNYQVIDTYPWLSMSAKCFEKSNVQRFPRTTGIRFDERRFLNILGINVINAINGNCSIEAALAAATRQYHAEL